MRRLLSLLIATLTALGLSLAIPPSASALTGSEWLGCQVSPGRWTYSSICHSDYGPANYGNYEVNLLVQAESAPSTYSWAIPSPYQSYISSGCTSTTNHCQLQVPQVVGDETRFYVSVTLTQGSATATLTASVALTQCFYC